MAGSYKCWLSLFYEVGASLPGFPSGISAGEICDLRAAR
jgi:hypothetical protein